MRKKIRYVLFVCALIINAYNSNAQTVCIKNSILFVNSPYYLILDTFKNEAILEYHETYTRHYLDAIDTLIQKDSNYQTIWTGKLYSIVKVSDSFELICNEYPNNYFYKKERILSKKKFHKKYLIECSKEEIKYYIIEKNSDTRINDKYEASNRDILYPYTNDDNNLSKLHIWKNEHQLLCYDEYCKQLIAFETEYVAKVKKRRAEKLQQETELKTKLNNEKKN